MKKAFSRYEKFVWKYTAIYQANILVALMRSSNLCHMGFSSLVIAIYIPRCTIDTVQLFCSDTDLYLAKSNDNIIRGVQVNHI